MEGGFTFKGIHSSEFGVVETPQSRVLSPTKKRTLIEIPGRSTAYIEEDGSYSSRSESILCSYVAQEGISLQRQVRLIAGWLDGVGELTFDYEPEMHYNAYLSSAPPAVKHLEYAQFTLTFTINHPFAYETATNKNVIITDETPVKINTGGTVETPVRIFIKNTGQSTINNLIITRKHIQN
jgi:predicted phage tail component-like protein